MSNRPRIRLRPGHDAGPGVVAATLFAVLFAAQASLVVLTPVVPDLAAEFGTSTASVGHLRVASALTGGLSAIALARLRRRLAVGDLLIGGLVLLACGSAASAAAPSLVVLAAAQAVVGVGLAILLAAAVTAAAEWVPVHRRTQTLAWALAGPPAAWIVGMPLIALAATGSWRMAWVAVPLLSSLLGLAAVFVLRRRAPVAEARRTAARGREHGVVTWAAGETLLFAGWGGTLVYAGALLRESYASSLLETGLALGAGAVAYLPGTFLARRWGDTSVRRLAIASSLATAVLAATFGIVRPAPAFSVAVFAALAFVAAARTFAGGVYALQSSAQHRAAVTGARAAAMQFGYLIGAALGAVALSAGGYEALGATFSVLFACSLLPQLRTRRAERGSTARASTVQLLIPTPPKPRPAPAGDHG